MRGFIWSAVCGVGMGITAQVIESFAPDMPKVLVMILGAAIFWATERAAQRGEHAPQPPADGQKGE